MARKRNDRDLAEPLVAAAAWIEGCLVCDGSVFTSKSLWNPSLIEEVRTAFVGHPDLGSDDFLTKLKGQMAHASREACQLCAEMLWVLLLFPTNVGIPTKLRAIREIWQMSAEPFPEISPHLTNPVLSGVGSGGPGYNTYRPDELEFLMMLAFDIKKVSEHERRRVLNDYPSFCNWINTVPQNGHRQFRHMLRYFAFPDAVERISSNGDRCKILDAFGCGELHDTRSWSDKKLDERLLSLRNDLQEKFPGLVLDFYESPLRDLWRNQNRVKTPIGDVYVSVPADASISSVNEPGDQTSLNGDQSEARPSYVVQGQLATIGAKMGFKICLPASDRQIVKSLMSSDYASALLGELPLNYDDPTLATIRQIDVIWLRGRSMARAFEVEHTTAVYSGILRMADLLALQPNMDIRLHIVAPAERRKKVFSELTRPVFAFLARGPLAGSCSFLSYESVFRITNLTHLAHLNDSVLHDYEERVEQDAEVEEILD